MYLYFCYNKNNNARNMLFLSHFEGLTAYYKWPFSHVNSLVRLPTTYITFILTINSPTEPSIIKTDSVIALNLAQTQIPFSSEPQMLQGSWYLMSNSCPYILNSSVFILVDLLHSHTE